MLLEIFKFEIKYRLKRPDTYIYFLVLFLFSLIAVDFIFEGDLTPIKENSPYVIAFSMGVLSAIFSMITSMVMGVAALRDFDHRMESLMFVNPIKKSDYLIGRFLGSFVILLLINTGSLLGFILSEFIIPWKEPENLIAFDLWNYLHPFFYLLIPTLFFTAALFFVTGALSRKLIVVYTQGILLFMIYIIVMKMGLGADNSFISSLIDPFSFQTVKDVIQFWTPTELNSHTVPINGILLYNRILWVAMGFVSLIIGYFGFSFKTVRSKATKNNLKLSENTSNIEYREIVIPSFNLYFDLKANLLQFIEHTSYSFKSIFKEIPFWTILICGMAIIFVNSISLSTTYEVESYPTTYIIIGELLENSILFFLMIVIFYSGELVWKERDAKLNLIYDALPTSDLINLASKFLGLNMIYIVLLGAMIFAGIIFQTINGYYKYEIGVYLSGFFLEIFPFLFLLTVISFLFHVLANHKFLGHILVLIFVFLNVILLRAFGYNHGLYSFGGNFLGSYSDMNEYGHFLKPYLWFKVYWIAFSIILFIIAVIFSVRGTESQIKFRWKLSKQRLTKPLINLGLLSLLVFSLSGCYIFYNTNILNEYSLPETQQKYRVTYEKSLKKFEHLKQPKIVDVNLKVDLYPQDRDYTVEGYYILSNQENEAINEIHIQKLPNKEVDIAYINLEGGAELDNEYEFYGYFIYKLQSPLMPGDSIKMKFKQTYNTLGFVENANTQIVYNGTFFNNYQLPTLGYNKHVELQNDDDRKEYDLKPRIRRAKIDDQWALKQGMSGDDGEVINFEMIISTSKDQTAIAPGYLQKEWEEQGRKYFHYKMDKPMSNFYSIVSARYEVVKDKWIPENKNQNPVNLEIFYHKGHEYNLDRMMNGMKKSLAYFSKNFGSYQYKQMRILETPSYKDRAVSFPNTVPFSESMGFILDIKDDKDVDMALYVTAHEIAHQWWGHQVNAANVQGKSMVSESLAQYSALMVLKDDYSEEKVNQFLKLAMDRYLKGRTREKIEEKPLALVESGQEYIHYYKGIINLNTFQKYISEEQVNMALSRYVKDWSSFNGSKQIDRYPTTKDLLSYFREVTPDSLQYLVEDLFETITLHDNKIENAEYKRVSDGNYELAVDLESTKYRVNKKGIENSIPVNDFIEIGVYGLNEIGEEEIIYIEKHLINDQQKSINLRLDKKPLKVVIDPYHLLIDRDFDNNEKVLKSIN